MFTHESVRGLYKKENMNEYKNNVCFFGTIVVLILQLVGQLSRERKAREIAGDRSIALRYILPHLSGIVGGMYVADMFTAMVHIVLDHVITPGGWIEPQSLPVHSILRTSAILFQQHHQDPSTLWKQGTTWDLVGHSSGHFPPCWGCITRCAIHHPTTSPDR